MPPELLRFELVYTVFVIGEEAALIDKMPVLIASHDVRLDVARLKFNAKVAA